MTKKQQGMKWAYDNARYRSLKEAYKTCSTAKEKAFEYCLRDMLDLDGFDMRITGCGTFTFSCAFQFVDFNGCLCLRYHTAQNVYTFVIN